MTISSPEREYRTCATELEALRRDGYFITPPLFETAELAAIEAEFGRIWASEIERLRQAQKLDEARFMETRPFIGSPDQHSQICRSFCVGATLAELAGAVLGSDVDFTFNQAIIKPPHPLNAFAWHQDGFYAVNNAYAEGVAREAFLEPRNQITFWIAITRTTVENGTLWVVPGLHRRGLLPHKWNDAQREWQCQLDVSAKIPVVLEPGQVLVFSNLLPHCSGANISNETRMAYQLGFTVPGLLKSRDGIAVLRQRRPV